MKYLIGKERTCGNLCEIAIVRTLTAVNVSSPFGVVVGQDTRYVGLQFPRMIINLKMKREQHKRPQVKPLHIPSTISSI